MSSSKINSNFDVGAENRDEALKKVASSKFLARVGSNDVAV